MQVYFVASSRLVGKDADLYVQIYKTISSENKMVSDKVLKWIKSGIKDLSQESIETKKENYSHVVKCIKKADIVIMEISGHSVSMGYILSKALEENKPVIVLYTANLNPVFVQGIVNSKLILAQYCKENIEKVIVLYTANLNPVFVQGIVNSKLILAQYCKENIEKVISDSINKAKCLVDMRFNFFVSPKILNYLDWVAQRRMIPRSVFLRSLIEREMKKDKNYRS